MGGRQRNSECDLIISTIGTTSNFNIKYATSSDVDVKVVYCDCRRYCEDLRILFDEVVSESNEGVNKWSAFESFIRKYTSKAHLMFTIEAAAISSYCSLHICSALLMIIKSCLRRGTALPIALKNAVKRFGTVPAHIVVCFSKSLIFNKSCETPGLSAANHDFSNLINLLLNFGLLPSGKNDAPGYDMTSRARIQSFL